MVSRWLRSWHVFGVRAIDRSPARLARHEAAGPDHRGTGTPWKRAHGCDRGASPMSEVNALATVGHFGPRTVAALYVATGGVYFGLPDVDPWDEARDARRYAGPWPVVAHPPCDRWGKFATGGMYRPGTKIRGDDGGCFASAIAAVRSYSGVLEHPQGSSAWAAFSLNKPPVGGGWVPAGDGVGWTCVVEQGHYGHLARKPTLLYAVGVHLPELRWGPAPETWRSDPTRSERWRRRAEKDGVCVLLSRKQRAETPRAFRDVLLELARSARGETSPFSDTGRSVTRTQDP